MEIFKEGLEELDIMLENDKTDKFKIYKELLKEWNDKINITAIREDREIDIKHFLDSLTVLTAGYIKDGDKLIDIGTGGGFPGLPIKIVNENINVTLLDSLNKRIKFLNEVINELGLEGIETIHGRAEDYGVDSDYREKFDISVSRAVASLNVLSEYCLPFVKVGGHFLAMKGPEVSQEVETSKNAIRKLGGEIKDIFELKLPFIDNKRTIVVIKKIQKTPTQYPRKSGTPTRKPL